MTIRKTGAATGSITEIEVPEDRITTTAAARQPWDIRTGPWGPADETALAEEDQAADQGDDR